MFCREQVAQLRDVKAQIEAAGAGLAVVGNGTPFHAVGFRDDQGIDFPLYVDPDLMAYRAAGLKRGARRTFNRRSVAKARATLKDGFRQGRTQGDPWQQGGVFVIRPDGSVPFGYVSEFAGDHPEVSEVLAALETP